MPQRLAQEVAHPPVLVVGSTCCLVLRFVMVCYYVVNFHSAPNFDWRIADVAFNANIVPRVYLTLRNYGDGWASVRDALPLPLA